jgi:hypothetical protein
MLELTHEPDSTGGENKKKNIQRFNANNSTTPFCHPNKGALPAKH